VERCWGYCREGKKTLTLVDTGKEKTTFTIRWRQREVGTMPANRARKKEGVCAPALLREKRKKKLYLSAGKTKSGHRSRLGAGTLSDGLFRSCCTRTAAEKKGEHFVMGGKRGREKEGDLLYTKVGGRKKDSKPPPRRTSRTVKTSLARVETGRYRTEEKKTPPEKGGRATARNSLKD